MEEQLFEAAMTGNIRILDQIQGPKIFAKQNAQGDTACHVAFRQGHFEFAVKIAKLHPPILFTPNTEGDTVLHCALKIRQLDFFVQSVNLIRDFLGENIKYTNELPCKVNSLMLEAQNCYNSSRDREQRSLVYLTAEKGYFEAMKILMELPALSSTDGPRRSTALDAAVRHGHYGIVQLLMKRKRSLIFDKDADEITPMIIAVELKDVKMCKRLLMEDEYTWSILKGGDNGPSAFRLAAQNDDFLEIFQLFTERCPSCYNITNSHGQNVLHTATKAKALGIVKFIMKDKEWSSWMINKKDNDGNTPLSLATASNGNEEMLNALLASPVNVPPIKDDPLKRIKKMKSRMLKVMEDFHSSLLVMATLITTVTFTTAVTMPGGYKSDGPDQGMATLIGRAAFKVFLVSDTISMCSSIITTAALILFPVFLSTFKRFIILLLTVGSIAVSIVFMLVAFAAGVWVAIGSKCKWLAILIVVMTSCTPLILILALGYIKVHFDEDEEEEWE